jgi:hypothetical protein
VAFEGDVKSMPLAGVLGTIARGNLTGTLTLKNAKDEWRIAFSEGFVVAFLSPRPTSPLLDRLVARGLVTGPDAEKVRTSPLANRQSLRSMIVSRGLMSEEGFRGAVTDEVVDGFRDVFQEVELSYRFDDGSTNLGSGPWNRDQVSAGLRIPTDGIILEGTRYLDEWRRIAREIGSMDEVVGAIGEPRDDDPPLIAKAHGLARDPRTVASLLQALPGSRFDGASAVAKLLGDGRLRRLSGVPENG